MDAITNQKAPWSISQIAARIKDNIKADSFLQNIYIIGEITDLTKNSSSGHIYFSITDKNERSSKGKAVLRGIIWKGKAQLIKKIPSVGDEVLILGSIDIYAPHSGYNIIVDAIQYAGEGDLLKKIELIRKRLREEGLTAPERKKRLPRLPRKIGIIAGANTAAFRDIIKQVNDRYPHVDFILAPATMQGKQSPQSVMRAIDEIIKDQYAIEVLIIARGGGSQEDLNAFNDEALARKIASVPIPVVTGIGHEVDHPVVDDVADVAAATPTDAAKIVLPDIEEIEQQLQMRFHHLRSSVNQIYEKGAARLEYLSDKPFFKDPYQLIETRYHYLDDLHGRLRDSLRYIIDTTRDQYTSIPDMEFLFERIYRSNENRFLNLQSRLDAYSPLATLKRGYSVVYQNKKILSSVKKIKKEDEIEVHLKDGKVSASVNDVQAGI